MLYSRCRHHHRQCQYRPVGQDDTRVLNPMELASRQDIWDTMEIANDMHYTLMVSL